MLNPGKSRYLSGKAVYKVFLVLAIIAAGYTNLHADERIRIRIKQPPPNMLGVGDMWNLTLENTTKSDLKIYLTGTATEEKDGLVIEGKSKVFTIKPGKTNYKYNDFPGAEVKYNNGKYKEIILRTGNAPEGSYTICVTAFEESGEIAGMENCIMQTVQQLGSITLLTPGDGEQVDPTQPIMFSWTPMLDTKEYILKIIELKKGETSEIGTKSRSWFETKVKSNYYQLRLDAFGLKFDTTRSYAWSVQSLTLHLDWPTAYALGFGIATTLFPETGYKRNCGDYHFDFEWAGVGTFVRNSETYRYVDYFLKGFCSSNSNNMTSLALAFYKRDLNDVNFFPSYGYSGSGYIIDPMVIHYNGFQVEEVFGELYINKAGQLLFQNNMNNYVHIAKIRFICVDDSYQPIQRHEYGGDFITPLKIMLDDNNHYNRCYTTDVNLGID